jgi:hypothetical protein
MTEGADDSLKSERTVGPCAVRMGPLAHGVRVGQLGHAGEVVRHGLGREGVRGADCGEDGTKVTARGEFGVGLDRGHADDPRLPLVE